MAEQQVQLFGAWASPFSLRIKLALKLKGIRYEYIDEDLLNKSPLLLKYNPVHKKIPVLVTDGKPVAESLVILEYIDETWQNYPILPKDPYSRAIARFWAKFVDEKILPAGSKISMAQGEEQKQLTEELHQNLKLLENELKGKELFGGEKIGYLDIVAFAVAHWFQVAGEEILQIDIISEEKFPFLHKWLGKLREIDVVKESVPPRDKHVALIRSRIEAIKSAAK